MFSESAEFYDLLYSTFKDYNAEVAALATLLQGLKPGCRTVLDVACGTGEHARLLADMADFQMESRCDAVLCLFSSIGYLKTLDRVEAALGCFAEHLVPGGVVLIEPWFQPGQLTAGRIVRNSSQANGVRVSRTSRVEVDGRLSFLHFAYEITQAGTTWHAHELHELGLFTASEMIDTFRRAGLSVKYDPVSSLSQRVTQPYALVLPGCTRGGTSPSRPRRACGRRRMAGCGVHKALGDSGQGDARDQHAGLR